MLGRGKMVTPVLPEPTPMLAHPRPPVGSIPDSRTSKFSEPDRSRSALADLCLGILPERPGHLDPWTYHGPNSLKAPVPVPGAFFLLFVYRTRRRVAALLRWS